jgi:hypothetical protein
MMAVVALCAALVACTPATGSSTTTMPSGSSTVAPKPGAIWAAGDSISATNSWPGRAPDPIASVAVPGRAFVLTYNGPTIGDNTLAAIDRYGVPSEIVLMGGVNDVKQPDPPSFAQLTAAMTSLEASLVQRGIRVVWATEPGWQFATQLAPLNHWIRTTREHVIDCAPEVSSSWLYTQDGLHPNEEGQQLLHDCIRPQL